MDLQKKVRNTLSDSNVEVNPELETHGNGQLSHSNSSHSLAGPNLMDSAGAPLAMLASIVQSSDDAIISKSLEGIITSWNDSAERIFGFTAEEMIGQSIKKLIPADRQDEEPKILERLRKGERVDHFETIRLTKSGNTKNISLCISPIRDSEGTIIGASKIARDITDQIRYREMIRESELMLKTISSASPVGLWMTDINMQNIFVNDTWISWTGISLEKQRNEGWLLAVYEDDRKGTLEKLSNVVGKRENYRTEFRIIDRSGKLRWCLAEGSPYFDLKGEFAGYAGSITDITEIKKLEERKDDFIKIASHELNTPITSIKGYVQLLICIFEEMNEENFEISKPRIRSSLQTISKQVSRLTRLITELLDLSRIDSGKLELLKTEFVLADLVEETAADMRFITSRHAIIVHNDFEGRIYADKDRISQVLLNLLTNAIKYSPDADRVEISVAADAENIRIGVRDYGIGIDLKDQPRIFDRFYRVEGKSEKTFPGFGIGLYIANEIIQRHGGQFSVKSSKGSGSLFMMILPVSIRHG